MNSQKSTKHILKDLEAAIKDLKNIQNNRNQILSQIQEKEKDKETSK